MANGQAQHSFSEFKAPLDKEYYAAFDNNALLGAEFQTSRYRSMIRSLN